MSTPHELGPLPDSVEHALRAFAMDCAFGDHAARVFGALKVREEMKAYALAEVARAVEAERERCAKLCDAVGQEDNEAAFQAAASMCSAAIREGAR